MSIESNNKNNDKEQHNSINLKRSTFTKLLALVVLGLMTSSFFAGYILRGGMTESNNQAQLSSTIQTLQNQQFSQLLQQLYTQGQNLSVSNTYPATTSPIVQKVSYSSID